MNSSNQQGSFQNQRMFSGMKSNQNQSNSYQPLGFVQSHYQGIPNQQTGRQSAGPVISHVGYSAASQQGSNQGYAQQNAGYGGSFVGSRSNQSNAFVNNFGSQQSSINNQPVISRVGYSSWSEFPTEPITAKPTDAAIFSTKPTNAVLLSATTRICRK